MMLALHCGTVVVLELEINIRAQKDIGLILRP